MPTSSLLGLALVGVAASEPADTHPQAVREAISVETGATCLSHEVVSKRVAAWLDKTTVDQRLRIEVIGDASEPTEATVHFYENEVRLAKRAFRPGPDTCENLVEVVALSIALAIDATVLDEVSGGQEPIVFEPPVPPSPPRLTPRSDPAKPEPVDTTGPTITESRSQVVRDEVNAQQEVVRLALGIHALGFAGLVPQAGFGLLGRLELWSQGWFGARIGLGWAHAPAVPIPPSSARVDVELPGARLDLCATASPKRVRLGGCAGAMGGPLLARTDDVPGPRLAVSGWAAVGVGAHVQISVHKRIRFAIDLDGYIGLVRPVLRIEDATGGTRAERTLPAGGGSLGFGAVFELR